MRKILIVDDEKIVRSEILRLADWEKYGMEVVGEAENGRAALEFLASHPVDVMITDLSMPGLSGMEFLQAVREKYPELRIIVMTMHQNFDYIQQAMRLGVVDYITKTRIEKENFGEILEGILKRLSAQSGVRQFQRDTVRFLCRAEGEGTPADADQALDDGVWLAEDGEVPEGFLRIEVIGLQGVYYRDAVSFLRTFLDKVLFYTYHRGQQSYFCRYEPIEPAYDKRDLLAAELQGTEWILDDARYKDICRRIPALALSREELLVFFYQPFLKCASYRKLQVEEYFTQTAALRWWYQWQNWLSDLRQSTAVCLQPEDSTAGIFRRAIQYIDAHYMQNLDLPAMLQMTAMSKSFFSAGFKEITGKSFVSYLRALRVEHAKQLLTETQYSIQDVALQVGYDDERYFRKVFSEVVGVSPAQYRKEGKKFTEN